MSELEARGPEESEHEAIISAYGRNPNYGRYIEDIVGRLELYVSRCRLVAARFAQCWLVRLIESERAPTNMRLKAHVASRLNQLRDTNFRPR